MQEKDVHIDLPGPLRTHRPIGLDELTNRLLALQKLNLREEAKKLPFEVSVESSRERRKFLLYCISLIPNKTERQRIYRSLLTMKACGMSTRQISKYAKMSRKKIHQMEREALQMAKDAIAQKRAFAVPIVGGN